MSSTGSSAASLSGGSSGVGEVGDVQEGRLLEADVDEGGLHAREHAHHLALVDVAGDAVVAAALDVELDERGVVENRNPRLPRGRVDEYLLAHDARIRGRPQPPMGSDVAWNRVAILCTASSGDRPGIEVEECGDDRAGPQRSFRPDGDLDDEPRRRDDLERGDRALRVDEPLAALAALAHGQRRAARGSARPRRAPGRARAARGSICRSTSQRNAATDCVDAARARAGSRRRRAARVPRAARSPRRARASAAGDRRRSDRCRAARPRSTRPAGGPGRTRAAAADGGRARRRRAGARGVRRARRRFPARACR